MRHIACDVVKRKRYELLTLPLHCTVALRGRKKDRGHCNILEVVQSAPRTTAEFEQKIGQKDAEEACA